MSITGEYKLTLSCDYRGCTAWQAIIQPTRSSAIALARQMGWRMRTGTRSQPSAICQRCAVNQLSLIRKRAHYKVRRAA